MGKNTWGLPGILNWWNLAGTGDPSFDFTRSGRSTRGKGWTTHPSIHWASWRAQMVKSTCNAIQQLLVFSSFESWNHHSTLFSVNLITLDTHRSMVFVFSVTFGIKYSVSFMLAAARDRIFFILKTSNNSIACIPILFTYPLMNIWVAFLLTAVNNCSSEHRCLNIFWTLHQSFRYI